MKILIKINMTIVNKMYLFRLFKEKILILIKIKS